MEPTSFLGSLGVLKVVFHSKKLGPLAQSNKKINSIFACMSLKNLKESLIYNTKESSLSLPLPVSHISKELWAFYPWNPPQIVSNHQLSQSFRPSWSPPRQSLCAIITIDLTSPPSFSFLSFSLSCGFPMLKDSPGSWLSQQQSFPLRRKERRAGGDYDYQYISNFIHGEHSQRAEDITVFRPRAHGPAEDSGETHLLRRNVHHCIAPPSLSSLLPPSVRFVWTARHHTTFLKCCIFGTPTASSFG